MTTQVEWIAWLRSLATKGNGAGMVDNIAARSLGHLADELERLYVIEQKMLDDEFTVS